jgi:hypothetical protein
MWSVQEAKAKLSRIIQNARTDEPRVIGRWLVAHLRGLGEIDVLLAKTIVRFHSPIGGIAKVGREGLSWIE